jgi:hypothetical protein
VTRCPSRDPVWDRQCEKDADHVNGQSAEDRLHLQAEPGDKLTWGAFADMREANPE